MCDEPRTEQLETASAADSGIDRRYTPQQSVRQPPGQLLTDEQEQIIYGAKNSPNDMKIKAFAGSGKTSTLRAIADNLRSQSFLYLAFNKAVQIDAHRSFPHNVYAVTGHALAYRSLEISTSTWRKRLGKRIVPDHYIDRFAIPDAVCGVKARKLLYAILRTISNFQKSANKRISTRFVDQSLLKDKSSLQAEQLARFVTAKAKEVWRMMASPDSDLPIQHDTYLKIWQISSPKLSGFDVLLFDETQDANPVIFDVMLKQKHMRKIYVGDPHQQIYSWRGAVNAMNRIRGADIYYLTQSFRFGREIANIGNLILRQLGEKKTLRGTGSLKSVVAQLDKFQQRTCLFRTNAGLLERALAEASKDKSCRVAVVGSIDEPLCKAESAYWLFANKRHLVRDPEIKGFSSWWQLCDIAKLETNHDLSMIVDFVIKHQELIPGYVELLAKACRFSEEEAQVILSTAHKAKGRQWSQVCIDADFLPRFEEKSQPCLSEELNLLYVACTRARERLELPADLLAVIKGNNFS